MSFFDPAEVARDEHRHLVVQLVRVLRFERRHPLGPQVLGGDLRGAAVVEEAFIDARRAEGAAEEELGGPGRVRLDDQGDAGFTTAPNESA